MVAGWPLRELPKTMDALRATSPGREPPSRSPPHDPTERSQLRLRMLASLQRQLRVHCAEHGALLNDFVEDALKRGASLGADGWRLWGKPRRVRPDPNR